MSRTRALGSQGGPESCDIGGPLFPCFSNLTQLAPKCQSVAVTSRSVPHVLYRGHSLFGPPPHPIPQFRVVRTPALALSKLWKEIPGPLQSAQSEPRGVLRVKTACTGPELRSARIKGGVSKHTLEFSPGNAPRWGTELRKLLVFRLNL